MRKKSDMRPYQNRVATHLYEHDAVQAVIPMGGGKTASAQTAIAELIADGHIRCALVIAPQRVAQLVWPAEPAEWEHLHYLRVVYVDGTPDERKRLLGKIDVDIFTIGVDLVPWLCDYLKALPEGRPLFDCLVIDESSKIKDPLGTWGLKLQKIADRFKIMWWLTGTFRPNGYQDQYRPLSILTKGKIWGVRTFDRWREKHFIAKDYMRFNWEIRPEHEAKIIAKIKSLTITIGDDEMPKLPPLTTIWHEVDLPPDARRVYDQMAKKQVASIEGREEKVLADNAAIAAGKLEQIAQGFLYDGDTVTTLHDKKIARAIQLSGFFTEAHEPHIIVYQFDEELRLLQESWPGLPYFGNGTSRKQAAEYERLWNNGELPRLAIHPASAAHGLNLQYGGRTMLVLCSPWSAELDDQMVKRIHRPGQDRECFVHRIVARGTIDQEKRDRVEGKITEQEAARRLMRRV